MTFARSRSNRKYLAVLAIVVGALILAWPAFLNGQPFLMSDTTTYVRGADAVAIRAVGIRTDWSGEYTKRFVPSAKTVPDGAQPAPPAAEPPGTPPVLAGRSIYYGTLLYLTLLFGSFWVMAAIQALAVSFALYLTFSAIGFSARRPFSLWLFVPIVAVTALLSPVGYFSSYMLPDIFSPLLVLALVNLLCLEQPAAWRRWAWCAFAAAGMLFHDSNFGIALAIIAPLVVLRLLKLFAPPRYGFAMASVAVIVGIAGSAAFNLGVKAVTGSPPIHPPFVMARLISDGPGLRYLQKTCPQSGFYVRRFLGDMPLYSDNFLWAEGRPAGLFSAVTYPERIRIANEQFRFVSAVVADRPLDVLSSSATTAMRQLGMMGLPEFNYSESAKAGFERKLPTRYFDPMTRTAAYNDRMPVQWIETVTLPAAVAALILMIIALGRLRSPERGALAAFSGISLLALLANDVICGALSTPHDRYQMRLIWIVVPIALMIALRAFKVATPQLVANRSTIIVTVEAPARFEPVEIAPEYSQK